MGIRPLPTPDPPRSRGRRVVARDGVARSRSVPVILEPSTPTDGAPVVRQGRGGRAIALDDERP